MDQAAMNGHLDVVKCLHANRREGCTTNAMKWATNKGHTDVIQWLRVNYREDPNTNVMMAVWQMSTPVTEPEPSVEVEDPRRTDNESSAIITGQHIQRSQVPTLQNDLLEVVQLPTLETEPNLSLLSIEEEEEQLRREEEEFLRQIEGRRRQLSRRRREIEIRQEKEGLAARRAQLEVEEVALATSRVQLQIKEEEIRTRRAQIDGEARALAIRRSQLDEVEMTQSTVPECPVCLDDIAGNNVVQTHCGHTFCANCFNRLPTNVCPICQSPL